MSSTTGPESGQECLIQPNPDIIGVGIRVSFYVLSLGGPLIAYVAKFPEFTASVESSLGITGLALFLTSVILTARNSIDLFHAICIFHLLALVGISITPKGGIRGGAVRIWSFTALYVIALTGALSYLTYVFATAPTFGSHPECNKVVKYVIFGINIPATNSVIRWIFVASFAFILFGFVLWLVFASGALFCMACDCFDGEDGGSSHEESSSHSPRRRRPFLPVVGHTIGCVYVIIMLELIIRRNPLGPGINEWTFGQVLAMMMLVAPLIELTSSVLGDKDHED